MYRHGWFQIAFDEELTAPLTPIEVGRHRLIAVRTAAGPRVFRADCPHRGAHLAYGGKLVGESVVCPFHHYRIGLGRESADGFCVEELTALRVGGLVFVRLSGERDHGLPELLREKHETHHFVPGFTMTVAAPCELVIENGYDWRHFPAVHRLPAERFTVAPGAAGSLDVRSVFKVPDEQWFRTRQGERTRDVTYHGRGISPGVFLSDMGGTMPYSALSTATPTTDGGCVYRLTLLLPKDRHGEEPDQTFCERLFGYSRQGLEEDKVVWERLAPDVTPRLTEDDEAAVAFQEFCRQFR